MNTRPDTLTTWKQYVYVDGKLTSTSKRIVPVSQLRNWIDNMEAHWTGWNRATSITRVSLDELLIVAKSGSEIRVVNR